MKKQILKINKNSKSAFIILFAVTLASIILSIALGVANISFKEASFSTSAKDSNDAFLAADSASECALFYDKLIGGVFPITGPAQPITCSGNTTTPSFVGDASAGTYYFMLSNLGSSGTSCSKVNVKKEINGSDPVKVTITSSGYNASDCATISTNTNPHLVERKLSVSSYLGAPPAYTPVAPGVTMTCPTGCTIMSGDSVALHWETVGDVSSCTASGGSGSDGWLTSPNGTIKSWPYGNQTVGPLTSSQTYTLNCNSSQSSMPGSVTVNVWTLCAAEGSMCSFSGTKQVHYGANGSYFDRTVADSIACDNDTFGDPIVGFVKSCYYSD